MEHLSLGSQVVLGVMLGRVLQQQSAIKAHLLGCPVCTKRSKTALTPVLVGLAVLIAALATGCTTFKSEAERITPNVNTNLPPIVEKATAKGSTLGGGNQALEKIAASAAAKSLSAGASGVKQESTLADLIELFKALGALKP